MTRATSSTWMPRAAMSVATRVAALPEWNAVHVAGAGVLAEVAVQLDGGHAAAVELAGQRLGAVLGAGEDDRAAGRAGQVDQHRDPVLAADVQHVVVHRRDRRLRRVGLVGDRLVEEPLDQHVDRLVERGREQQPLAVPAGSGRAGGVRTGRKPRSAMWSASSSTVISTAPSEQWPWPIRSSSRPGQASTMSTPRRRPWTCGFWPTPPKTVRVVQAGGLGQRREGRVDLADQLAGRGQDQGARAAAAPAGRAGGEPGDQRAAGTRRSCRSRCGRGRARRGRRASRAASRPGSGVGFGDAEPGEDVGQGWRARRGRRSSGQTREVDALLWD